MIENGTEFKILKGFPRNIYHLLIIPFNSITIDASKEDDEIISMVFIEGRWKNRLKNGIVFFSMEKLKNNIKIIIDEKRLIIKENNNDRI